LSSHVAAVKDPAELAERVRSDLGRAVCDRFRDEQGRLHAIVLDPRIQQEMLRPDRAFFVDPQRLERFLVRVVNEWRKAVARGQDVALLCDAALRRTLRQTLRSAPDLAVIAFQEVPSDLVLEPVAVLKPEDLAQSP
jgi:flagellar biosynthesis protein FlhA